VISRSGSASGVVGSAADSLKRIKERQSVREEQFKLHNESEDRKTGADLDAKLAAAGILPGGGGAEDVLARLMAAEGRGSARPDAGHRGQAEGGQGRLGRLMRRLTLTPRPDWKSKAEAVGFTWHHADGRRYWDERAAYAFTLEEVEGHLEPATEALHKLCLELVDDAVKSDALMARLQIPEASRDLVAASWTARDPSLYGRFDFSYDGAGPPKLYEYNADTPTSIYEAGVFQWLWLEDLIQQGLLPEGTDQFNSLHDQLADRFKAIFPNGGFVHFASDRGLRRGPPDGAVP
jgi:hypothetical protein